MALAALSSLQRAKLQDVPQLLKSVVYICTSGAPGKHNNEIVEPMFYNRNPRNLERLRIAWKPQGYSVDKPGKSFWHKLIFEQTPRHITAKVVHYSGNVAISASTREWAIKKFLYSTSDISAHINLAKVFAQRCIESGITEVYCDLKVIPEGKMAAFLSTVEEGGVVLSEPARFLRPEHWHKYRPEKPWEVVE